MLGFRAVLLLLRGSGRSDGCRLRQAVGGSGGDGVGLLFALAELQQVVEIVLENDAHALGGHGVATIVVALVVEMVVSLKAYGALPVE